MSFASILGTLLIRPLQLVFEVIFTIANRVVGDPGLSIIALSLAMNFLVLPLYRRADAMQEEERDMELRLHDGVSHIKKTFRGDERMMILQTYYRQNNYKPTYVLRGATSLFLEIPFFIAAYRFLSGLQLLHGVSFGPIADLGRPDGLLTIAGYTVNVLPIIMTLINLISCVIFTKGSLLKTKIQLYSMAVFFLFFLYTSPAGLVFYWTLNNAFSLVKTIFYKLKHADIILRIMASVAGIAAAVYGIGFYHMPTLRRTAFFIAGALLLQLPLLTKLIRRAKKNPKDRKAQPNRALFITCAIFMAVLTGAVIPSTMIKASPQEFVDLTLFCHPTWYVVSAFCFAVGTFVIWMGIFYWLAKPSSKVWFDRAMLVLCGASTVNYMFFGRDLGNLGANLKYDEGLNFDLSDQLINLAVLCAVAALLIFLAIKLRRHMTMIVAAGVAAFMCMSGVNLAGIASSVSALQSANAAADEMPEFTMSRKGKNVIVLMLDRGMGAYMPYIFNEKPELKEQFAGFTVYSNTISFGKKTNFASPALFGGYEYTPAKLNSRSDMSLMEKQNESLKVMPVLFDQNGYNSTVFDPTYAGYQWIPDLSIYDDHPTIHKYITKGKFTDPDLKREAIENNKRNFFCFGITKAAPLFCQMTLYYYGNYNKGDLGKTESYVGQTVEDSYKSTGLSREFMEPYNVLASLSNITKISTEESNNFLMMTNDTTHEPMMLSEPDYTPSDTVDNTEYEASHSDRFTLDGRTLKMESSVDFIHYQANMASLLRLGEWFDYMRDCGVWNNTRIIIVSDHGHSMEQLEELINPDGFNVMNVYPLLMVKDFGATEFSFSDEFMTNADVPTLATDGVIDNPTNPFTGNAINSADKTLHDQYIFLSDIWNTSENDGNTFRPGKWYTVHDNIWDSSNWQLISEDAVLTEEK